MRQRKYRYFSADFETTVYRGQERTDVWAAASVELYTEDVHIFHTISELFDYFVSLKSNIIVYFHNLKFDGSFWLDFLLTEKKFKQAYRKIGEKETDIEWLEDQRMDNNTFKYAISFLGQWYNITIKVGGYYIQIRDSLKLLPFSVERIGQSFGTKHKKQEMEYKGFRYPGCEITSKEKEYIGNDVLVVKEALEIMFDQGHKKMTIGSCCLHEYKQICKKSTMLQLEYDEMFPNLYEMPIDKDQYGFDNAGDYIRSSYRGGWCYLVKGKEGRIYHNGTTADVNSLYPSMMYSESGNYYPVGNPHFWKGNYIPPEAEREGRFYYVRVKTRFYLRGGKLPVIQIKNSYLYKSNEWLETSDLYDDEKDCYYTHYKDAEGNLKSTARILTLSVIDYKLIKEQYELVDFEILDGCWFYAEKGIFDEYIDKYREIKMNSEGAIRELAKLFLNNLYGKLAMSTDSSFKLAYLKPDGVIGFKPVREKDKKPGYIPAGAAVTSYARNFTIRAAQQNYHGADKPGFIYADTDSIHVDLSPEQIQGIKVHKSAFCAWKLETCWDESVFLRQKTYVEHVTHKDLKPVDKPFNLIKCAGMPEKCKQLFDLSMSGKQELSGYISEKTGEHKEWTEEEKAFLFDKEGKPIKRTYFDFKVGLKVPGKLMPHRMPGGIVLEEGEYQIR